MKTFALLALTLLILSPHSLEAQDTLLVEFKVFPQDYELTHQGIPLLPARRDGTLRWYRLPAGPQIVSLAAPQYFPSSLSVEVAQGMGPVEAKLEPRNRILTLAGQLPTGKLPRSVQFSLDGTRVFVPLQGEGGVDVFQINPLQKLSRMTPAANSNGGFFEAAVHPVTGELWVSQMNSDLFHVFDAKTLRHVRSFPLGGAGPRSLAFTSDGSRVFISNWNTNTVSVAETAGPTLLKTLNLPGAPRGLKVTSDDRFCYIALFEGSRALRINAQTLELDSSLVFGEGTALRHLALGKGILFLSDMNRGRILSVDLPSEDFRGSFPLDININTMVMDPDQRYLYAALRGRNNPAGFNLPGPDFGKIYMIDTQANAVVGSVWGHNQPTGLDVSPDGQWLVFSNLLDNTLEFYRINKPQ